MKLSRANCPALRRSTYRSARPEASSEYPPRGGIGSPAVMKPAGFAKRRGRQFGQALSTITRFQLTWRASSATRPLCSCMAVDRTTSETVANRRKRAEPARPGEFHTRALIELPRKYEIRTAQRPGRERGGMDVVATAVFSGSASTARSSRCGRRSSRGPAATAARARDIELGRVGVLACGRTPTRSPASRYSLRASRYTSPPTSRCLVR